MFRPCWSGWRTAIGLSHRLGDGNVVSSLHCMNDPQLEGHMASHIERRKFLATLGGAAAAWPLAARAQQPARLPTIGVLGAGTARIESQRIAAFLDRMHELGWIEGRTITIEYRWAEGRAERMTEIAAEFVRLNVDLIFASAGSLTALAAKQATSVIPIVFAVVGDPLGVKLVDSLARPGGNITGMSLQEFDLVSKRLELLREIIPDLRRLAIMGNVGNPAIVLELDEVEAVARRLGLEVVAAQIRQGEDIVPALEALKGHADAIYIASDPMLHVHRVRIIVLTLAARLPATVGVREYVEAGGLMSYGPNFASLNRRAAEMVDRILRGAKPADIPVEQPTKFDFVINLTTARVLDLKVPEALLLRADEVIE